MPLDPIVATAAGRLRGRREAGLAVFRGIPFAAPPLGARRFAAPAPVAAWDGVRDATAFGPAPPQPADPLSRRLGLLADHPTSEDCLHLNVWTPATDAGRRPVMVWLHGGAFLTGTGSSPAYGGARLAARGDVVVVTLDYRVGALGFLAAGPGLANAGLRDQIAALGWVRREIAGFGGDPERICVFGESAGAGSLVALLAMPAARGLFRRAIVQSAACEGQLDADEAAERARIFAAKAGVAPGDLDALRVLPVERLLEAQAACAEPGPRRIGMFFAPVVDGGSLPQRPTDAVAEGAARDVSLVIGTTADEMRLYALWPAFGELDEAQLLRSIAAGLPASPDREAHARRILDLYRAEADGPRDVFFALETDRHLFLPAVRFAEAHARHQPDTWSYLFTWRSPLADGALGACHALDVPFTLGHRDGARAAFAGEGPEAERVEARLMDAWIAFARDGDPSHPGLGTWPRYESGRRATLALGAHAEVWDAPREARRRAFAEAGA